MSELALTILRIGFVLLLWLFLAFILYVLWQGLKAADTSAPLTQTWPRTTVLDGIKRLILRKRPSQLIVRTGVAQGLSVPLIDGPIAIGRSFDNALVLDEEFISDHHAVVKLVDGQWVLEDLNSTNGTWVKGERVSYPKSLGTGSFFGIGDVVVEVR